MPPVPSSEVTRAPVPGLATVTVSIDRDTNVTVTALQPINWLMTCFVLLILFIML